MIDSSDHICPKTGLSPTVTISKNGAIFAAPSGAITEVANGWYKVAGNATDSNTLGPLLLHASAAGADPVDECFNVVAFDPDDTVRLGLSALPNAAAEAVGGLYTRGSGPGQINQPANGQVDVNAVKVSGTAQTARDLGAQIDATVSSRLATSGYIAPDNSDISAIKAKTDNLPASPAAAGSAMTLTAGERDAVAAALLDLTNAIETGLTPRGALRLALAVLAGKVSGAGTGVETFRNAVGDSKDRIVATTDTSGNRTGIVVDVT